VLFASVAIASVAAVRPLQAVLMIELRPAVISDASQQLAGCAVAQPGADADAAPATQLVADLRETLQAMLFRGIHLARQRIHRVVELGQGRGFERAPALLQPHQLVDQLSPAIDDAPGDVSRAPRETAGALDAKQSSQPTRDPAFLYRQGSCLAEHRVLARRYRAGTVKLAGNSETGCPGPEAGGDEFVGGAG
jgi:hypothetical protein